MSEAEGNKAGIPRMFRAMLPDGPHPRVGMGRDMLGVRVPTDVNLVLGDQVQPGKGMSVFRSIGEMPPFLIPPDYKIDYPEASGKPGKKIWRLGTGAYASGLVSSDLFLQAGSSPHGEVEPARQMSLDAYQTALADTKTDWVLV